MALDPRVLLRSLRRRWFSALFLGLLVGGAAGTAAWYLVPAPYSAKVELRMMAQDDRMFFKTSEPEAKFDVRKQTNQKLLTSERVLVVALRSEHLRNSAFLRETPNPVDWLAANLKVGSAGTEFITLSLEGDHPEELAPIVNAVAEAFIEVVVDGSAVMRLNQLAQLDVLLSDINRELDEYRNRLKVLVEQSNSSNGTMLEQKQQQLLQLHVALRQQIQAVHLELIKAQIAKAIQEGEPTDELVIPDAVIQEYVKNQPEYRTALSRIEGLERYAERTKKDLAPNHPSVTAASKKLDDAKAELEVLSDKLRPEVVEKLRQEQMAAVAAGRQRLDEQIAILEAEKAGYEQQLERLKIQEKDTGELGFELAKLDGEIARREAMASSLADEIVRRKFEIQSFQREDATKPVEIFQEARTPRTPDLGKRIKMTGLAGAGGFGLIVAGIVLLDSLGRRISSISEVSGELSTRLIGSIPSMPRAAIAAGPTKSRQRPKVNYWQHALKESVDSVRTLLLAEASRTDLRVIAISSAASAEGKTTLACHVATSLARAGRRVALIDCDLRRPAVDRVFAVDGESGVCEVLRGELGLEEVTQPTAIPGLSVIAAGTVDAATLELLSGDGFGSIIESLRGAFDFVIVDTAPVLPVCDALLVAQHVDTVVLAVRRDISRLSKVAAALSRFAAVEVPVMGAVAIGLDDDPVGYGGYYRSRDRYRYALSGELVGSN